MPIIVDFDIQSLEEDQNMSEKMEEKLCIYGSIIDECVNTYVRKNSDYGDSFSKIYKRFGLQSSVIRLFDKLNRLESLIENERQVDDETIEDTLEDMINYTIMTLIEERIGG